MTDKAFNVGDVIEGKGGKKYVYTGGDRNSKDSYKPFNPPPAFETEKPEAPGVGSVMGRVNELAGEALQLNPMYQVSKRVGDASSAIGDFMSKGAYDAGGKVTDIASGMGASPEVAAGAGYATNVATQGAPSILAGTATKSVLDKPMKDLGRWAMQIAVKPPKAAHASGDAAKAIETMLKEGINVTPGGMNKLSREVGRLSGQVDDIVNAAERSGATVSKVSALKAWSEKLKEIRKPINSKSDVAEAHAVLKEFLEDPRIKDQIPIRLAQDLKTATYQSLGKKAYNPSDKLATANIESQKSIIRGLKEGIERAAPEVAAPNKRMQELLNAIEVVEPSALGAGNMMFGGLSYLAENLPAAAGMLLARSRPINSILGRLFYNSPSVLGNAARVGTAGAMSTTGRE